MRLSARCREIVYFVSVVLLSGIVSLQVSAETLTATVSSYNSTTLSGDVPEMMTATFLNENHSKGQIVAGKSATLTLGPWPNCTITGVSLLMHSNRSSGAGVITVMIDGQLIYTLSGTMQDWVGTYATEDVSLSLPLTYMVNYGQTFSMTVTGTENSLYLSSLSITYLPSAPQPYCVDLVYPTATVLRDTTLCELAVASGVVLPSRADLTDGTDTWAFAGWSATDIALVDNRPAIFLAGTTYYPTHDGRLYAVYTDASQPEPIAQKTDFALSDSCELAIGMKKDSAYDMCLLMAGKVSNGVVPMAYVELDTLDDGTARIYTDYMPAECRYRLKWVSPDTARIIHIESGTYVGYSSNNKLSNTSHPWLVGRAERNSLYFYHDLKANNYARFLWFGLYYDSNTDDYYDVFTDVSGDITTMHEGLLLFDVTDLPLAESDTHWSSNPFGVVQLESIPDFLTDPSSASATKLLLPDGRIIIRQGNEYYTIVGQPID